MLIRYLLYWVRMVRFAATGGRLFYGWMTLLAATIAMGLVSYGHHITDGLAVTNMTDQVSWGIGIANFVYFVGVAAAAAILVVPAYLYHREDIKEVVLIGEMMAVVAVVMCLMFILSDVGRADRLWHLMPPLGLMNFPDSLLAWDVIAFNGYLLINLHIPGYLLYRKYCRETPKKLFYLPLVFVSIVWALSIHTVTAFLLSGLGSRPFWNSTILAPRFLISAGASGPAILYVVLAVVRKYSLLKVKDSVFDYLRMVLRISMPLNMFLVGCELFTEFYPGTIHATSARYLFVGLHGHSLLVGFIWTALAMNLLAIVIFVVPKLSAKPNLVMFACWLTIFGIWTEKGVGLVLPGFTPTPLGELSEYAPNWGEIAVNLGIVAIGLFAFTLMVKVAVGVLTDQLKMPLSEVPRELQRRPWLDGRKLMAANQAKARAEFGRAISRSSGESRRREARALLRELKLTRQARLKRPVYSPALTRERERER